jgi:hypothetical protein
LYFLPSTNTCLLLNLNLEGPILNEPSASSLYTPNIWSWDTLRLNTPWIYFEGTGETLLSVSVSDYVLPVLNTGAEPIMRLRFAFVLKLGLLSGYLLFLLWELGWGHASISQFSSTGPDAFELASTYCSCDHYYLVLFNRR